MSAFSCPVVRVRIEPHPNADAIEIARVGDYQSIVKKGQFQDGSLAVYIPEQSVLPEWLLKHMGFWDAMKGKGGLSGSLGNRVRAIKLRGVLSQGLVLDMETAETSVGNPLRSLQEGEDIASYLEITKYEPPIPSHMAGKIAGVDLAATLNYDFENIKKHPDLFDPDEPVMITEKIHGTFMQVGVVPSNMANDRFYKGRVIVTSKGLGAKGFILDHTDETNLYIQCAKKHGLLDAALSYFGDAANDCDVPYFVCGEVFGKTNSGAGVQDLTYNGEKLAFRAFDVCAGTRGKEEFFDMGEFLEAVRQLGIEHVPILYVGPYSKERVLEYTDGSTFLFDVQNSHAAHIREGVVIKCVRESRHPRLGRKIAKSVSEAYLLRKNATEFN
jgi:RNA ligase (TIGR02306 family)